MLGRILFLVIVIVFNLKAYTQRIIEKHYFIITFEKKVNKYPQHGIQRYYKIIESDSVINKDLKFNYILMSGYSNDNFELCQKGIGINPYLTTSSTNFNYDKKYLNDREALLSIIQQQRKWIQTIKKNWSNELIDEIKIYVTPVKGNFCSCIFKSDVDHEKYFEVSGFLPFSDYSYDAKSWTADRLKYLFNFDFSKVQDNINPFQ